MRQYCLINRSQPHMRLYILFTVLAIVQVKGLSLQAQTCPSNGTTTINAFPNTYFPGTTATLNAGSSSIALGAASFGSTSIASGDLLLIIQMQGTQIGYTNDSTYGKNFTGSGRVNGYINNAQNVAGNMEYVVATNAVGLAGGTVNLLSPTTNNYQAAAFSGGYGQYTYQVIRVASYYNLFIGGTINVPAWDGATGGVMVVYVTNNLNLNGQTITASGAGFRGGGGVMLSGGSGGSSSYFRTLSTKPFNGSKGEGIAGTPRYINNNGVLLDYGTTLEGYPVGSFGMGAPGNAGAGGTDGAPLANSHNSGGGGGSNGSEGGKGGNSWSSNLPVGGEPGGAFAQAALNRLVMGGGGGAGTTNNGTGTPGAGMASSGAAGGGIVMIYALSISGTGTIDVSGADGNNTAGNDASGGGGAGGSIVIAAASGLGGVTAKANGGTGGSNNGGGSPHGPGGGGGGGVVYASGTLNAASTTAGGVNGTTAGSIAYGSTSGAASALLLQNQVITSPMSCTTLPLNFLSVSVTGNSEKVNIGWKVTNETGVLEYIIERSTDGVAFTPIGTLMYHSYGNTINDYRFGDLMPATNRTAYYRVQALDAEGHSVYSRVITIKLAVAAGSVYVSPNPVREAASLNLVSATGGTAEIILLDLSGRPCWRQHFTVAPGANILPLEGLEKLHNGVYLLQYNDGSSIRNTRLLIGH